MAEHSGPLKIYKFHSSFIYRAIKSVKAGGNVFNCYGPHFRRHSLTERQETLKAQYHFVCDCVSCKRKELVEFQERFSGKFNFGVLGSSMYTKLVNYFERETRNSQSSIYFACDCVSCKRKELVEFQERFSGKFNFGV